jgi:nuclear cap-binding protein subunit 1
VLTERLPPVSADGDVPNLRAGDPNVTIPAGEPEAATMDIDNENGADNNRSVFFFFFLTLGEFII